LKGPQNHAAAAPIDLLGVGLQSTSLARLVPVIAAADATTTLRQPRSAFRHRIDARGVTLSDSIRKADGRDAWESAAPGWAKWEEKFSAGLDDVTDALLDMAGVGHGMRVIDLACGSGSQSLRAAWRVGPTGRVLAVDISRTMLEHLRENARRAGLNNIDLVECEAEDLHNAQGRYDAGICRLGLMLFPSPLRALAAVQRALEPNARFAALVFTAPATNPFMARPMEVLLRHAGREPPTLGQPGIFALGGEGALKRAMADSGFTDVRTRIAWAPLRLSSASEALEMMREAFGAYRAVVADLGEAQKAQAWAAVAECLQEFETSSGFETKLEFLIGAGAKPL
jgi:ubiquinone/menaquinone biosynthesis C-methylase UbiE